MSKDDGMGLMLSSFQSCDFGYNMPMTEQQMSELHETRKNTKYASTDAAKTLFGNDNKQKLTSSPFQRELQYGKNNEGYWDYNHMAIHLEDVVDALKHIYGGTYEFIFFLTIHLVTTNYYLMD